MGAQVRVVMTRRATEFVTPLTFQALSGHPVYTHDCGEFDAAGMDHIALSRWADAVIVAPATANMLAKLTHGIADDFLSSLCLAHTGEIVVAPAMNQAMWNNESTRNNLLILKQRGTHVFGPDEGLQACGETGAGRMMEPDVLASCISAIFSSERLAGRTILLTAGPTVEPIDPVRFICNRSSGKMGYALAEALLEAGGNVTVVSGPTHLEINDRITFVPVETAAQMHTEVLKRCANVDIFIAAAAVADYSPSEYQHQKIKKQDSTLTISLSRTPDILKDVKLNRPELFCVGFAAETENIIENALNKLQGKSVQMIIANPVGDKESGFDSDYNAVEVLWQGGQYSIERARKTEIARKLVSLISDQFENTNTNSNVSYFSAK